MLVYAETIPNKGMRLHLDKSKAIHPVMEVEIPTKPDGLLKFINEILERVAPNETSTAQSIRLEKEFEELPLTMKLHFAALAMEHAREHISNS